MLRFGFQVPGRVIHGFSVLLWLRRVLRVLDPASRPSGQPANYKVHFIREVALLVVLLVVHGASVDAKLAVVKRVAVATLVAFSRMPPWPCLSLLGLGCLHPRLHRGRIPSVCLFVCPYPAFSVDVLWRIVHHWYVRL